MNIQVTIRFCLWAALLLVMTAPAAIAATVTVVYVVPGDGFDSAAAADPASPAPGATLGAQRKASFEAAANFWGLNLTSNVPILVDAQMTPLFCNAGGAVLGSAGAITAVRDHASFPLASTWYHIGLGNKIADVDLAPAISDVGATFNSDIDNNDSCLFGTNWYYDVVPGAPLANTISFFDVVLHEIGHGIGVSTFVNLSAGTKLLGFDDTYMTFLEDHNLSGGTLWPLMSNAQRLSSAIDGPNTHFTGPAVQAIVDTEFLTGGVNGGHAMVYAPNPLQSGSSISHWDTSMDRNGTSEIMEPFAVAGAAFLLTFELLEDIGWGPTGSANAFTVSKDFSDDNAAVVDMTLTCSSGTVTTNPLGASEGSPALFEVTGFLPGATCTATEAATPGYDQDDSACQVGGLAAAGGSCTMVNTLEALIFSDGFE